MVDKKLVKERFLKHQDTYHHNAKVQFIIANKLAHLINIHCPLPLNSVLEIGVGTGFLTKHLHELNPNRLYLNDIMDDAVKLLNQQYSNTVNLSGDIESVNNIPMCELIASSSTFQWLNKPYLFFSKISNNISPGGLLAFSSFGIHNCKEIREITGVGLEYIKLDKYKNILTPQLEIIHQEEQQHTLFFDTAKDVVRHMKDTGVNGIQKTTWMLKQFRDFERAYEKRRTPKGLPLSYHSIIIIAKKKSL